jgi:hypothetical protein
MVAIFGPLAVGKVMRTFIKVLGLVACVSIVSVSPSFADCILDLICIGGEGVIEQEAGRRPYESDGLTASTAPCPWLSFCQTASGGGGGGSGGGAPAPEIGATALGMLLAGGLASYIRARQRK